MSVGDRPNIVIIVMDCVRAQNLPVYGYDKPTAPRITELAGQALRFDNAITTGEQTLASTASFFSGTYPSTHELRIGGETIDDRLHLLAEALSRGGYATHCINCNNPYISPWSRLPRGFGHYTCAFPAARRWIAELRGRRRRGNLARLENLENAPAECPELVSPADAAIEPGASTGQHGFTFADWLRWLMTRFVDNGAARAFAEARRVLWRSDPSQPVFVYVHLMETHSQYLPPLGHWARFLPDCQDRDARRVNHKPPPFISGAIKMDALDFEIVEGLYNGTIHYTDRLFGRFFDWLAAEGRLDNTVVVLTADHGENFGDHGLLGHGQCVYDTVVRVPLLIWGPVVEGRSRGSPLSHVVQNIDLTASCLEWAGTRDDPLLDQLEGHPLPLTPTAQPQRQFAICESIRVFERALAPVLRDLGLFDQGAVAVRSKTHKLIWNTTGQEEFYDLARDPGEKDNLIDGAREAVQELRGVMEPLVPKFRRSHEAALTRLEQGEPAAVDPLLEGRLRDLGYID